ncbi:MAG: SDR family NAD(P)-dependent oxidoreductase, partial [Pseudomonadota bacterium]
MADLSNYESKLALVTGAGDGIGAMLARSFASVGMRVCVQDIREDAARGVAEEIGGGAFPLAFDVSDRVRFALDERRSNTDARIDPEQVQRAVALDLFRGFETCVAIR